MNNQKFIVRTNEAGVFFGEITERESLKNTGGAYGGAQDVFAKNN